MSAFYPVGDRYWESHPAAGVVTCRSPSLDYLRLGVPKLARSVCTEALGSWEECRGRATRLNVPLLVAQISESLCRDHVLDHLRFVIDYEMRVALHHRERFVSKYVGDFKQ